MQPLIIPIHPLTPEQRYLAIITEQLRSGSLLLYPSDTGMAFGCALRNKAAIERIRRIRNLEETKYMTFLCPSLSNLAEYAQVSNRAYRIIRRLVPGPVTFILPATKAVPSYAHDPKRRTVGIRVPAAIIPRSILESLNEPLISITAKRDDDDAVLLPEQALEEFGAFVDCAVTVQHHSWHSQPLFAGPSTVLDLTGDEPIILRKGAAIEHVEEVLALLG
ncbi:MAG: threonylcarbamoyl-AMP synthase [Candidatus Kapaibacterium sp.]|nr:MAG: threonylcarbamoyl-AMP synthase [Candidatus Kapabacteria bacterium]